MKKNLRIVSAAAAALLAVAPVAATVVPAANANAAVTVGPVQSGNTANAGSFTVDVASENKAEFNDNVKAKLLNKFAKAIGTTADNIDFVHDSVKAGVVSKDYTQTVKFQIENTQRWAGGVTDAEHNTLSGYKWNDSHVLSNESHQPVTFTATVKYNVAPQAVKPNLAGAPAANASAETTFNSKGQLLSVKAGEKLVATKPVSTTVVDTTDDTAYATIPDGTKMTVVSSNSNFTLVSVPAGTSVSYVTGQDKHGKATHAIYTTKSGDKFVISNGELVNTRLDKATDSSSTTINGGSSIFNAEANTTVTINAVAAKRVDKHTLIRGAINGGISVTLGGKTYDALLHTDGLNNVDIFTAKFKKQITDLDQLTAGHYVARFNHVTVALDPSLANTDQTFTLSRGQFGETAKTSKRVHVNANGVADLGTIEVPFYAYDATKEQGVHFYEVATGNVVTSGNVTMHAVNGKLSVQALYAALNAKYGASQFRGGLDNDPNVLKPVNDLKNQLEKAGMKVSPEGYFTPNASFSINMNAKSNLNGATATLPVTVTVDNVTPAASQETTKTVTIMHIAAIYDKNGVATHDPALRAYDTYSVVSEPVTINGAKFYKLAGKDQYIKVGNVDGTSRTLKHNSYVYKSTGKRANKKTLKKGSSVTTYGKSFMIAGHQMYRIGKNQYVKKANF